LEVAPRFNTAYHPEAARVIERFNGSFKTCYTTPCRITDGSGTV